MEELSFGEPYQGKGFRALRRATKGSAFGNRHLFEKRWAKNLIPFYTVRDDAGEVSTAQDSGSRCTRSSSGVWPMTFCNP